MCGRFTLHSDSDTLNRYFGTDTHLNFKPRYNISPSTSCPIVRLNPDTREIAVCQWGLIPHWAKGDIKLKPINAKAETIKDKPYFRNAYKKQRCLVPANGYFEWRGEKGKKQPYYIKPVDSDLFSFAGLWETWDGPEDTVDSFVIITTEANKKAAMIHNRMPVILARDDFDGWLVEGDGDLLRPCLDDAIEVYKVSSQVNKPGNEGNQLIDPD